MWALPSEYICENVKTFARQNSVDYTLGQIHATLFCVCLIVAMTVCILIATLKV